MTRREKLLRLCEFNGDISAKANNWLCCISANPSELKGIVIRAAYSENTRLTPILTALIERVEQLEGALEFYASCTLESALDPGANHGEWAPLGTRARQALAESPLDALLQGEK